MVLNVSSCSNGLRIKKPDILFLQETHTTAEAETIWKLDWGKEAVFAHGSGAARGTCILFRQSINKKIYKEITDPNGRYIILDMEHEGLRMTLANIYAPNDDDTSFYINVIQLIESLPNDNQIIGGDFNLVLDLEIDKKGGRKVTHRNSQFLLKNWMEDADIVDIWRTQHPEEKCIHGID